MQPNVVYVDPDRPRVTTGYTPPPQPTDLGGADLGGLPDAPVDDVELAPERENGAWAERQSVGQQAPDGGRPRCSCEVEGPGVSGIGAPNAGPRPANGAPRPEARVPDGAQVGVTGVRRRAGLDQIDANVAATGDLGAARALLTRATELTGQGPQLRFQIGDREYTAGQLRYELENNAERFRDFLGRNGISVAELNEVVDDVIASAPRPGSVFDLRAGSELARAYRLGGANGADVDVHLDAAPMRERAAAQPGLESRVDLSRERVEGPGFFRMVGEAILEGLAAIGRLFGASWNPDTMTFNGRLTDRDREHFQTVGRNLGTGEHRLALQAILAQPNGEQQLRQALLAQRPQGAREGQWARAVDATIAGIREGLASEQRAGRLPAELSAREGAHALVYLRANGFSAQARQDVELLLRQPEPVRQQALELLVQLPERERNNMLDLFRPRGAEPGDAATDRERRLYGLRTAYSETSDAGRRAMFETFRRDGFRADMGSHRAELVGDAVRDVRRVPEALRDRYLALVPRMGIERMSLMTDWEFGVRGQLGSRSPEAGARFLDDVEARLGSTQGLARTLATGSMRFQLTQPNAGLITRPADQRAVVDAFETHNLRLVARARDGSRLEIDVARYFSNQPPGPGGRSYRDHVLAETGMRREAFEGMLTNLAGSARATGDANGAAALARQERQLRAQLADPATSAEDRESAEYQLERIAVQRERLQAPMNVEIDLSAGSRLDGLFGLRAAGGDSAELQIARQRVLDAGLDLQVRVRGPSQGRRPGREHNVDLNDVVQLHRQPPPGQTARQAFEARYPGLDYEETMMALARLVDLSNSNQLPMTEDFGYRIDLTGGTRYSGAQAPLNDLGARLRDGRRGNVRPGGALETTIEARDVSNPDNARLWTDGRVGAAAGNNWFQYGIFDTQGYGATRRLSTDAQNASTAAGTREPGHVIRAIYGLDRYDRTHSAASMRDNTSYRELGISHGRPDDFLVDPRTGQRAQAQDFHVLAFTGRGSASDRAAFDRSAQRFRDTWTGAGGLRADQTEVHANPSASQLYRSVEGEIMNDRRPAADQGRPRTVVVYYAGHTTSDSTTDQVLGFDLNGPNGREYFTPEMMGQLNRRAREQGVNLVWVSDACRAGEYVNQARAPNVAELEASGQLGASTRSLAALRQSLVTSHQVLTAVQNRGAQPAPMPNARALADLGAAALRGGAGSPALDALRARRDQVVNAPGVDPANARLMQLYVESIEGIIQRRGELNGTPGMAGITDHGLITGTVAWRPGRPFKTQTIGPLEDRMGARLSEMNATPLAPVAPERRPAP